MSPVGRPGQAAIRTGKTGGENGFRPSQGGDRQDPGLVRDRPGEGGERRGAHERDAAPVGGPGGRRFLLLRVGEAQLGPAIDEAHVEVAVRRALVLAHVRHARPVRREAGRVLLARVAGQRYDARRREGLLGRRPAPRRRTRPPSGPPRRALPPPTAATDADVAPDRPLRAPTPSRARPAPPPARPGNPPPTGNGGPGPSAGLAPAPDRAAPALPSSALPPATGRPAESRRGSMPGSCRETPSPLSPFRRARSRAKRDRSGASTGRPSACSGDMYATVPTTWPSRVTRASSSSVGISRQSPSTSFDQAEVQHLGDPSLRHHHVLGLEVPVDDPPRVRRRERVGHLDPQRHRLAHGQLTDPLPQRPAPYELHHDVRHALVLAYVEDGHHVRVVERRGRPRLLCEPPPPLGVRRLSFGEGA